jgi:hypothetical protein
MAPEPRRWPPNVLSFHFHLLPLAELLQALTILSVSGEHVAKMIRTMLFSTNCHSSRCGIRAGQRRSAAMPRRLDELAEACAADGSCQFRLTAKPLNLIGGVGSPANALAVKSVR